MLLRLAGCGALGVVSRRRIGRSVMTGLAQERVRVTFVVRSASRAADAAERTLQMVSARALHWTVYVTESSAVITIAFSSQSHRDGLRACVTNLAGLPSNVRSDSHLDLWRSVPGQLPMNNESCERETLPRMQKNNSSRLIAAVPAAPQRRAKNCSMRGPF
jgi:hypothetical protein